MLNVVSKDSRNITPNVVVALRVNGNVLMVIVLPNLKSVMVLPNALTNLTRASKNAASKASHGIAPRSVDVIQSRSILATMVIVLTKTATVMVNHNAKMDQMKERKDAVSRASNNTTRKSVDATLRPNGPVPAVNASTKTKNVTVKLNALTALMSLKSAASEASNNTVRRLVDVTQNLNGLVLMVNVSQLPNTVTVMLPAKISLIPPMMNVVSKDLRNIPPRFVVVKMTNGNVLTPAALPNLEDVMVKPNVLMNLMRATKIVVSRNTHSTTLKSVAATLRLNGPVPMVIVSVNLRNVTEEPSALTDLTREMISAASESSPSTTTKNVAASKTNGNVKMVIASAEPATVMVKPNVKTTLMKVTNNVASEASDSTTRKSVAATLRLNGLALMANASTTTTTVMVNLNAEINLMRTRKNAASESSKPTVLLSVAATQIANGHVQMVIVSLNKVFVMEQPNA
jgi:hypothetical protein